MHLVDNWGVGCSTKSSNFAVLHNADESQPAGNKCLRLHFDSRFGLYHVADVQSCYIFYAIRSALQFSDL